MVGQRFLENEHPLVRSPESWCISLVVLAGFDGAPLQ
jgi:hypothetical protein